MMPVDPSTRLVDTQWNGSIGVESMIRPTPGYVWGAAPAFAVEPPLYLAHSDLSGLSLFEEAQFHGTRAAEAVMARAGHAYEALT